jgi:prepilin-type N-terminal cleavage/methylation domain-containing protein
MNDKKQKSGFTLIELLVVIAIIGILSAIGITALSGGQIKARDAKRQADLHELGTKLATYLDDHANYPLADTTLSAPDNGPVWIGDTSSAFNIAIVGQLQAVPNSPRMGTVGTMNDYWYITDFTGANFALFSKLENTGVWYVYNNRGWAQTVDGSESVAVEPAPGNTECVTDTKTVTFSPCLSEPKIQ